MKQAKIFFFFLLSLFFFTLYSCSSPTGPPAKIIKDPRTYTWSIDTLKEGFQTDMTRVWGSSPNDVYLGGHGASVPTSSLWHFDGNKWSIVNLPVIRFYDINSIYGFSSMDVWAVGSQSYSLYEDSSLICHYDGSSWKEYPITGGEWLQAIWGSDPTKLWAVGNNTLFHFDGTSWKPFSFFIPPQGVQLLSISGLSSNDIYMTGYRNDVVQPRDTAFYYLYHFNGSMWSVVDSSYATTTLDARKFGVILKAIDGTLYSAGDKLFKKEGDNWTIMNDDPLIFSLGGSSKNNIFAAGINAVVYHYNGSDWKKIIVKEGFQEPIYDVWTDGTEAFMVGHDGSQTYVIHGK